MEIYNNTQNIVDSFIDKLKPDSICIDMTLGNGKDSLKIIRKIPNGKLYAFDLQSQAIDKSSKLFERHEIDKNLFNFINDGHENLSCYIDEGIDFAIYNLGYLPGGDKSIVTKKDTTVQSLKGVLSLLNKGGTIVMTFYLGHKGGKDEYLEAIKYMETLPQKKYTVLNYRFINQKNSPPQVITINKRK